MHEAAKDLRRHLRYRIDPVRSNIPWRDVVALFEAPGAEVTEGKGSRVRVYLNGERAVFHKPHPEKETDRGSVMAVRRFLTQADAKL